MPNKTWKLQREISLRQMGFKEDPFTPSADPRFLYLSAQHGEVLSRTQGVIENSRGLAVVEGGFGVGKSTIARRLESIYRSMPDDYRVAFVHSSNYPTEFAALLDICAQFGVEHKRGLTKQWREFELFLVKEQKEGRDVVIILDEAQRMDPSALGMVHTIYNFDVRKKLAQVILFGQPEVNDVFRPKPEIRNRVYSWFTLHPLSFADAYELVRFRCKVAGRDKMLFSESAYLEISQVTNGVPRDLVILCSEIIDEVTRQGKNPGEGEIDDEIVMAALESFKESSKIRSGVTQPSLFSRELIGPDEQDEAEEEDR